jgi:hypothetical protein
LWTANRDVVGGDHATEPAPIAARTGGPLATLVASFGVAGENFVLTVAAWSR